MTYFRQYGLPLLVLIATISECRGKTLSITREENAVLPCFDSNVMGPSCYRVKWIKYPKDASQMKVILAWPQMHKSQDAERVTWEADGKGQMSLFLTKLQKSDEGLYSCEIWQGWDRTHVKNISLKIKECKTLQPVKAAPSTAVNLNCPVNTGQSGPRNISWALLKGGNPVSAKGSERVEISGTSLAIQSVSSSDSGWYRCKYMLGQIQRCFDINLLVRVENSVVATTVAALTASEIIQPDYKTSDNKSREEGSSGTFIADVTSIVIGTAIIVALIGLCIYSRPNTQRVTQLTQRHTPDAFESVAVYETMTLTLSSDHPANQRVNSLYQQVMDESMCTFNY